MLIKKINTTYKIEKCYLVMAVGWFNLAHICQLVA